MNDVIRNLTEATNVIFMGYQKYLITAAVSLSCVMDTAASKNMIEGQCGTLS